MVVNIAERLFRCQTRRDEMDVLDFACDGQARNGVTAENQKDVRSLCAMLDGSPELAQFWHSHIFDNDFGWTAMRSPTA